MINITQYKTVTVKKAPTDESVRLLRELEKEAKANVESALALVDNNINCIIHAEHSSINNAYSIKVSLKINGRIITVEYTHYEESDINELYAKVINKVVQVIVHSTITNPLSDALRKLSFRF